MLEFFADEGHWTRGSYDDGKGGHCLVGALLHLGRKHLLPTAPAIALLQDAMPDHPTIGASTATCCRHQRYLRSRPSWACPRPPMNGSPHAAPNSTGG